MKAMVTGGGGFLGRRLVELLLQEGHEVHFLARGLYPEVEALGATSHQVDLLDAGALPAAMQGIDTVFHVAAKAGVWGSVFKALSEQSPESMAFIDSSIIRAHQHAAGGKKGARITPSVSLVGD